MPEAHRDILRVGALGACGGLLGWIFSLWLGTPPHTSHWVDALISTMLGLGAGIIFVFLVANTDRTDLRRLIALSLLSGFFWEPVWEGAKGLVERRAEEGRVAEAAGSTQRALALSHTLAYAPDSTRDSLVMRMNQELARAAELTTQIRTIAGLTAVRVAAEPLTEYLARNSKPSPQYFAGGALLAFDAALRRGEGARDFDALWQLTRAQLSYGSALRRSLPSSDPLPAIQRPSSSQITMLEFGKSTEILGGDRVRWFRVQIPHSTDVTFTTQSKDDLILELYESSGWRLVAADDDSGGELNPSITIRLGDGAYLLRVSSYERGTLPEFVISATAAPVRP